jgi:hypothetical protein
VGVVENRGVATRRIGALGAPAEFVFTDMMVVVQTAPPNLELSDIALSFYAQRLFLSSERQLQTGLRRCHRPEGK